MTTGKTNFSTFIAFSLLVIPCASGQSSVTFDFDTGTPALIEQQSVPFEQTAGGITARFSTTPLGTFLVQSDRSTNWTMSRLSGKYLVQTGSQIRVLTIQFNRQLADLSFAFATADFEIEVPSTIRATAYLDSTTGQPVGTATARGTYNRPDTMPAGTLSFNSGGKPFNIVEITVPFVTGSAAAFVVDNIRATPFSTVTSAITSNVCAASYTGGAVLAPASIATIFGQGLATASAGATTAVPPTTLADTTVTVKDSAGAQRSAPLFYVGPAQINYVIPEGTALGAAEVTVSNGSRVVASGAMAIETVAPGLFTANADGKGAPAASAITVAPGGTQTLQDVARCGAAAGSCLAAPIDLGSEGTQVILALYGTGIRGRSGLTAVTARIGGVDAPVLYAGQQTQYVGLDQVNVSIPRALAGRGEVDLVLTVNGKAANTVRVNIR